VTDDRVGRVQQGNTRPAYQALEAALRADGFSCREQIRQTTGRRAHHLAEIVERTIAGVV
jgi:hypothetical protein